MAAESVNVLSSSFANCPFSPYYFGSALKSASSEFLGLVCSNLSKVLCMYPGIEITTVSLL